MSEEALGKTDQPSRPSAVLPPSRPKGRTFAKELPFLVAVALVLAILIKTFLIQAFYIPSGSMENTLHVRDRVLVNKVVYRFRPIHRGEIVVFNGVDNFGDGPPVAPPANGLQRVLRSLTSALGVGPPDQKDFIKRVIGLPGDTVACCSASGNVMVRPAGSSRVYELHETYLYQDDHEEFCAAGVGAAGSATCPPGAPGIVVPQGKLWVLGDHRGASADSRFHVSDANHGTVPIDKVIGRAFVIVWPVNHARILRVPAAFDAAVALGFGATSLVVGVGAALPLALLRRRRKALSPL